MSALRSIERLKMLASRLVQPLVAAVIVMAFAFMVSAHQIIVTSAGNDQRHFHFPTVLQIRDTFPSVDWSKLPTATGPLYHLVVAFGSAVLGLGAAGTEVLGSIFAGALAALALWRTRGVTPGSLRALAVAPLLLSAYFWQSALWMLTDAAAALFAMAAFIVLNQRLTGRSALAVGMIVACAVATRQTYIWLLGPALVVVLAEFRTRLFPATAIMIRVAAPGMAILTLLILAWGGLTPPSARAYNAAGFSMTAIPFVFGIAAIFLTPVAMTLNIRPAVFQHWRSATAFGVLVSAPAAIWISTSTEYPDSARRGGFLWTVVASTPAVQDRSISLILLSFVGGFSSILICRALSNRIGLILPSALLSMAIITTAGAQLFPKYAELPVAVLTVLVIASLTEADRPLISREWPLLGIFFYQICALTSIVLIPIISNIG